MISGRGGGYSFCCLQTFLFTSGGKQFFFLAIKVRQFFFYVMSKKFFVVCFPYYVRYHLVFFLVNIFFINFDNKLFFLLTFSTNFFFLNFGATNSFFQFQFSPPPPDIKWCVPNIHTPSPPGTIRSRVFDRAIFHRTAPVVLLTLISRFQYTWYILVYMV